MTQIAEQEDLSKLYEYFRPISELGYEPDYRYFEKRSVQLWFTNYRGFGTWQIVDTKNQKFLGGVCGSFQHMSEVRSRFEKWLNKQYI